MDVWDKFKPAIDQVAFNLFFNKEVTWNRLVKKLNIHGENDQPTFESVNIKALIEYNVFRIWPIDRFSPSGQMDGQHLCLIINKHYLNLNGWLNAEGNFDFNPGADYFVINGKRYHDAGFTEASQADSEGLLFYLILKRQEYRTGEKIHSEPE